MPLHDTPIANKLYVPKRLLGELDMIFQYPLTVVLAPSGSGKTVAVQEFLKEKRHLYAGAYWYTAYGESLHTVWKRLCSVIAKIDSQTANALCALESPVRERLSEIAEFVQELHCEVPTVLVIDNYQLIQSDTAFALITALAQHGNEHLHIVIITQSMDDDLEMPLSAPHMGKLNASHFLFKSREVFRYFKQYGFTLSREELRQVMDCTSGWVCAVRLQLINYQMTGKIKREPGIGRLLYTAIWNTFDFGEQRALVTLSLLPRISAKQIAVMLGTPEESAHVLALLDELAFVSFDKDSQCYVLHEILRTFLQDRFCEYGEGEQQGMLHSAGETQLLEGELFSALRFFTLAKDWGAALSLPLRNCDLLGISNGEITEVLDKITSQCPDETLLCHPEIFLVFALEEYIRGNMSEFEICSAIVRRALEGETVQQAGAMQNIAGEYALLMSFTKFNDLEAMNKKVKEALALLKGPSTVFDFNHAWTFGAPSVLYQYWRERGALGEELEKFDKYMPEYTTLTKGHGMGAPTLMRAEAALYGGKLSGAEALCHKALYLANTKQQDALCFGAEFQLARIAVLRGDAQSYSDCLEGLHHRMMSGREVARHLIYDQCRAWLSLSMGDTKNLPDWLMDEGQIQSRMYGPHIGFAMMLHARILLMTGNVNKMCGLSDLLLSMVESIPMQLPRVYYLIFLACGKAAQNSGGEAVAYLNRALDIALPDRIYLPFAEHGAQLEPLLRGEMSAAQSQGVKAILAMCAKQKAGVAKINRALHTTKDTLTPRELEIVQLAKLGKTNREIGQALFISTETVKMALKNVFKKLGIHSRHQL